MDSKNKKQLLYQQLFFFIIVGIVGFIVNALIVEILSSFIGPVLAQSLAFPVAATVTWLLNRKYTFGLTSFPWHIEWMRYISANAVGWSANNCVYFVLIFKFPFIYQHPSLAVVFGSIAGMFFNFSISKWFVFK